MDSDYSSYNRWLITPYKDNGHLTARQRQFNYKLSSIRAVVERSIALLKGRWRKIRLLEHIDMELIVQLIMSACIMHNFCIMHDDFDDNYFLDDEDDDGSGPNDGCNARAQDGLQAADAKRTYLMNIIC